MFRSSPFNSRPFTTKFVIAPLTTALTTAHIAALCTALFAGGVQADDATALTEKLEKHHYTLGNATDAINDYELDGWNYIDKTHIVIHSGPSRDYLISLMHSCEDLSAAENIAFTTTTRKLTRFDKLMVRSAGGMVQNCPLTRINVLTKIKH